MFFIWRTKKLHESDIRVLLFLSKERLTGAGREVRCEEQVKADEDASRQMALLCICVLGALHLCTHSVLVCINEVCPTCISLSLVCWSQRNAMKCETSRYEQNQPLWCCCRSLWSHFRVWISSRVTDMLTTEFMLSVISDVAPFELLASGFLVTHPL